MPLLDGGNVPLRSLQGQVVLVNYWAVWCKPCREEIPELNHFAAEHKGNIAVFGVNFDAPEPDKNRAQAEKLGIEFPVLAADPAALWQQPQPQVLPATFVIDRQGNWSKTLFGPQTEETLKAAVAGL